MKKSKIISTVTVVCASVAVVVAVAVGIVGFSSDWLGNTHLPSSTDSIANNGDGTDINESVVPPIGNVVLPSVEDSVNEELIDAYKIFVDGDVVGIVSSEDELDDIMSNLFENYKDENNVEDAVYEVTKDIQIKKVQTYAHNITASEKVEDAISDCMVFKVNAFELSVEGYHLGYYATEQECVDILQSAKDKFVKLNMSGKNVTSVDFDRKFDIDEVYILSEDIEDTLSDDAVEMILSDRNVEKRYTVTSKERLDEIYENQIANIRYDIALSALEENGVVSLIAEDKLVRFVVKVATSTVKALPYSTTTKINTSLLYNVKRTTVNGVKGSVTTNYEETYIDGEYVSTEEVSSKTVNPVNEVVEYGTKLCKGVKLTALTGLGKFIWPTTGYVTGLYGVSNGFVSKHTGIDIGATRGTSIYASAAGEVVEVGYSEGGWGYYVKIKHDSTYSTLYLHMSRYIVTKGQKVKQGEVIGYVGSTGAATGPHCHFSILKNGEYIDPITMMYGYAN